MDRPYECRLCGKTRPLGSGATGAQEISFDDGKTWTRPVCPECAEAVDRYVPEIRAW